MDNIRNRRLLLMNNHRVLYRYEQVPRSDDAGKKQNTRRGTRHPESNKARFYFLTVIIFSTILFGFYSGLLPWEKYYRHGSNMVDTLSVSMGLKELVHSAVIDAGSTGSRILAYTFIKGGDSLKLYNELFVELKPGLSAFAAKPAESRKNIEQLIALAKEVIPEEAWSSTPIVMKATAGLRLLPGERADALLSEAKDVLGKSGLFVDKGSVSIMDGVDEGLFSWFTVNFLLDRLGGEAGSTVAALDLGGGSTQISFAPVKALRPEDEKYMHRISAFHRTLDVYTHSYLGLGLNEARKEILQYGNSKGSFVLKSECVNPIIKDHKWKHGPIGYLVNGPADPEYTITIEDGDKIKTPVVRFEKCKQTIRSVLGSIDKPTELNSRDIYAFSYYFDRAADAGLIEDEKGGVVTAADFFKTAEAKCKDPNTEQPFLCLDLTFISVLLTDGFGLAPTTRIHLAKRVDDHEISWALGAAFHRLQNEA